MNIVFTCVTALTLLLLGLSINVSRLRRKSRTCNPPSQPDIAKAVRAQGNASEYIPVFIVLLLFLNAVMTAPNIFVSTVAIITLVSRVVHAVGMLSTTNTEQRHPFRTLGALGTYVSLLLLGAAVLVHAF